MVKKKSGQQRGGVRNRGEVNKGAWTAEEDQKLVNYINTNGDRNWRSLPLKAGLKRCGKSCRLRWLNYLRPGIKRGNMSEEEEDLIIRLHNLLGNRWSLIAGRIPGRTDNEIKNHWNTQLSKRSLTIQDLNLKLYNANPIPNTNDIPTPLSFISTSAAPPNDGLIPNPTLTSSSRNYTTNEAQVQPNRFEFLDSDFNFEQLLNCVSDHQSFGSSYSVHDQLGLLDDYCINDEGFVDYDGHFKFKGSNISSSLGCLDSLEQLKGQNKSEFDDLDLFLGYHQDDGLCFSNC